MAIISLSNVDFKYGKYNALDGIDIETRQNELLGIIGPNGSGKSTLLKLMSGLLHPLTGTVCLDGTPITSLKQGQIARKIAFVPQNSYLPELFTSFEIVIMGRTPHLGLLRYESQEDINIAVNAMDITHTGYLADKPVNQLSGGERQRVIIARALAQQADILLLDEPTVNLDISYQIEILHFLRSLCSTMEITVVVVLHDLNLASQFCDRLIVLKEGRIYSQGKPSQVLTPAILKEVFNLDVYVGEHPINGLPTVLINADGSKKLNGNE